MGAPPSPLAGRAARPGRCRRSNNHEGTLTMPDSQDRIIDEGIEQLIAQGPAGMAAVFTRLFNLAMRFERENFLGARHYKRRDERRGYANGVKSKRIDTPAGTLILDVPKTADTDEPFYPRSLERGTRSSRALMLAVAEMYVKGVSTAMSRIFSISSALTACLHHRSAAPAG